MPSTRFRILLSDIGGVLGTNGWDGALRFNVCHKFGVNFKSIDERHRLIFDSFERGYLTLDEYLSRVFFSEERGFTPAELRQSILESSVPWVENISFLNAFRRHNQLQLGLVSNEGEGITAYRVRKFKLRELADFMVISHFTHLRKPDPEIWQLALNVAGGTADECIYIDDRLTFVEIARDLGFEALQYRNLPKLQQDLANLGLELP